MTESKNLETPQISGSEEQMKSYYESLSEKDRRRYAAIEANQRGYGGLGQICKLLGCNYRTIRKGITELKQASLLKSSRIRRPGGGRKKAIETIAGINEAFLSIIENHTAGSPMNQELKWTNLTRQQIADLLATAGISVSVTVVDQLLLNHQFHRRKAVKTKACGSSEHRNEQFEKIAVLKREYGAQGNPVMSMDSKKKS
jgi:hypothetical protein